MKLFNESFANMNSLPDINLVVHLITLSFLTDINFTAENLWSLNSIIILFFRISSQFLIFFFFFQLIQSLENC